MFYIPNGFSPNGDGTNDFFTLFSNEEVEEIKELIIVDRWGEIVFTNNNFIPNQLEFRWDDIFNGTEMDPAVFVYVFKVRLPNGKDKICSEDLVLVR